MNATTLKYRQLRRCNSGTPKVYDWMVGTVAGLEKLASVNSLAVRTSIDKQTVLPESSLYSQSVREMIAFQSEQLYAALTKTFAYCRHVEELAAENGDLFASVMLKNLQGFVATMSALIGVQPAESGQGVASDPVTTNPPAPAACRKIVIVPGSTAFFADRVPRGRLH